MYYLIDSANQIEIEDALSLGVQGITANTSMYLKNEIGLQEFLKPYIPMDLPFLSAEVIGESADEMMEQALRLIDMDINIVIKINFSKEGLKLANRLHKKGIKTAMTLVFTLAQSIAAINAHVDYIFFFIGRNEEIGIDALAIIEQVQAIIMDKGYATKIVAASIKHLYHLETLAALHIDYAAIPYALFIKSLEHPLTQSGSITFQNDWYQNAKNITSK
ncbi:MAG: transaldolase family protein [Longicatena sp.]